MLLQVGVTRFHRHGLRLCFDPVQHRDPRQGFGRDRAAAGDVLVEPLAPRMRPAGQLGHALGPQRLVAAVLAHYQRSLPARQERTGVRSAAAGLELEHDLRWTGTGMPGTAIGEQVGPLGLAGPGVEQLHRRLVGVQHRLLP